MDANDRALCRAGEMIVHLLPVAVVIVRTLRHQCPDTLDGRSLVINVTNAMLLLLRRVDWQMGTDMWCMEGLYLTLQQTKQTKTSARMLEPAPTPLNCVYDMLMRMHRDGLDASWQLWALPWLDTGCCSAVLSCIVTGPWLDPRGSKFSMPIFRCHTVLSSTPVKPSLGLLSSRPSTPL